MSIEALATDLVAIDGVILRPAEPMSAHLPLRVGGPAELWAVAQDLDALSAALTAARRHKQKWRIHWPMQDWIVRDGVLPGLTLRPGRGFELLQRHDEDHIRIGAATPWAALAGLGEGWWSELCRWPGTPGGLFQDGQQQRLSGMCRTVAWYHGRSIDEIQVEDESTPPILPATAVLVGVDIGPGFLLYEGVEGPVPPRAGQLFADPEVAGRKRAAQTVLREADIPGSRLRSWRMSPHEPGTVVNLGGGTARDLQLFAQGIAARVEKARGIKIDLRLSVHGQDALSPRKKLRGR